MTERNHAALHREPENLQIGPSSLHWDGTTLTAIIQETTFPVPTKMRGTLRIHPHAAATHEVALDAAGRHRWGPIFPGARIEVTLTHPNRTWSGTAYVDTNSGSEPLEEGFNEWNWCRAPFPDGSMAVLYHGTERSGAPFTTALRYAKDATAENIPPPPRTNLKPGFWRVPRATLSDAPARIVQSLEDAPFYTRSVLATHLLGSPVTAVHESLSLPRFTQPWVQLMLPFKAPRALR
jgi:carotenoid 1,2-hydratase